MNTAEKQPVWIGYEPGITPVFTVYHYICARCDRRHDSPDPSAPPGWNRVDAWDNGTVLHCPDCRDHADHTDQICANDPPTKTADFWLVWCPTGAAPPRYRHSSRASAEREAERLARLNAGKEFFVLEPRFGVTFSAVRATYQAPVSDDEVPF